MATLSLTVLPAKALKGGKHKIRVAVAHNSTTRYILTDVTIDSKNQFKNGQVVKRDDAAYLNTKLRKKVNEVQRAIDELDYIEGLSCAELVSMIQNESKRKSMTMQQVFDEILHYSNIKDVTRYNYTLVFRKISKYIPPSTPIRCLTRQMVMNCAKNIQNLEPISQKMYLNVLSRITNYAQSQGYAEYRIQPTKGIMGNVVKVRQNWLSVDQVRFMRDHKFRYRAQNQFADYFMLSYYLGGINIIDLVQINFRKNMITIKYERSKTKNKPKINQYVEFNIPEEAKPLIRRHMRPDGTLKAFECSNELQSSRMHYTARAMRETVGSSDLTYYSARKSFAQHAFMLGISESVIDYILGHSLGANTSSSLYSYIKVTPDMATAAIRKVLDFLAGTDNFSNFASQ